MCSSQGMTSGQIWIGTDEMVGTLEAVDKFEENNRKHQFSQCLKEVVWRQGV